MAKPAAAALHRRHSLRACKAWSDKVTWATAITENYVRRSRVDIELDHYVNCKGMSFFFSSRRRHTRSLRDWSSDVCSSDLEPRLADPRLAQDRDEVRSSLG